MLTLIEYFNRPSTLPLPLRQVGSVTFVVNLVVSVVVVWEKRCTNFVTECQVLPKGDGKGTSKLADPARKTWIRGGKCKVRHQAGMVEYNDCDSKSRTFFSTEPAFLNRLPPVHSLNGFPRRWNCPRNGQPNENKSDFKPWWWMWGLKTWAFSIYHLCNFAMPNKSHSRTVDAIFGK